MKAALRIATILVFATQAVAYGGTQLICRYTGQVMESCCCQKVEKAEESAAPTLSEGCCCDVRKTERTEISGVVSTESTKGRLWVGLPLVVHRTPEFTVQFAPVAATSALNTGPPADLQYLKMRQLLI